MADKSKTEADDCCQAPQFPEDKHGPKYDNDTPKNWLRGYGQNPNFDKHKAKR